jgi:hypothetical protein
MMRMVRMAGRGGLPKGLIPSGLALSVRNNVPESDDGQYIAVADGSSPKVVAGTDILTVRGAFSAPIYQVNPLGGGLVLDNEDNPTTGSIRLRNPHTTTGIPQDLAAMVDAVETEEHVALLLVSPIDTWAVVEVDRAASEVTADPNDITVAFNVGTVSGIDPKDGYLRLSGGWPSTLGTVAHVALLEAWRYYVREERPIAGDDSSDLIPRLVKARFYPNSELPHGDDPDFGNEVADNILDMQIALGIDTDGNGLVDEGVPDGEAGLSRGDDDWLFNHGDDTNEDGELADDLKWNPIGGSAPLYYVRLTTTARTDRRDFGYQAELLDQIQDRDFTVAPHNEFNTLGERRFRRRTLDTIVDMRNL